MAFAMKALRIGGEGRTAEIDSACFGGHIRPENLAADRIDRRLAENRSGKRQVVVALRERGGRTVQPLHGTRRCVVGLDKALRSFRKSVFNPDEDEPEMNECHAAALSSLIVDHIRLARSRCETLGWLIASILTAGTVNLTRLAPHIDSAAQITSVHRRLERFFRDLRLNEADVARLVVAALSLTAKPWHLAIDRTNWQFGKTDLNLLVLSVASWRRVHPAVLPRPRQGGQLQHRQAGRFDAAFQGDVSRSARKAS